jgi:hypothetical protein
MPLSFLVLCCLCACGRTPTPAEQAQAFWDTLAGGDLDRAMTMARVEGDPSRLARRLQQLEVARAEVERLDVPAEATLALLPTRLYLETRQEDAEASPDSWAVETVTVLRRQDGRWLVAVDDTLERAHEASLAATGERIRDAAKRLTEAAGASAEELARTAEAFAEAFSEQFAEELAPRVVEETRKQGEALADELVGALGRAGEELVRVLEQLEAALSEAAKEPDPGPSPDAP